MKAQKISQSRRTAVKKLMRKGAVAALAAVLMVPFAAMVALAVDIAWIVQARSDLQSAADAAALAGAEQLQNGFVQYSLPGQTQQDAILAASEATAKTYAKNFASYNKAGGVSSLVLNDSDIQFGFTDASGNYSPAPTYSGFPNTIKVTMRLDSSANGSLKFFFASVLGDSSANVSASAAATIYTANIINFNPGSSTNAGLLPMTVDMNNWNTFVQSGVSSDGTTHASFNGAPQMQIYPTPTLFPGNFGMLSLNDSSNSASDIANWIENGLSASDIASLQGAGLLPLGSNLTWWSWKGAPGFKASDLNDLTVGQTYLMPIFMPVVAANGPEYQYQATDNHPGAPTPGEFGTGSNTYYNVVQFVGVTVTTVDKSTDALVQPAAIMLPAALFDKATVAPAGTTSSLITTFTTPKLTQ
jgi:Flp pilus assembly protein TadG